MKNPLQGYNVTNLGDVQGAQAAINDQYERQKRQARYQGISNFLQGQQTRKRLGSMAAQSRIEAMNEKLDPNVRKAYEREAQTYDLLSTQLPYLDPEKQADAYYRTIAAIEDPRKLANELRKTQMQNEAEILKARIYAGAQGGGTSRSNKTYDDLVNEGLGLVEDRVAESTKQKTSPGVFERFSNMLNRSPASSSGQTMTASPYQAQPMLPTGAGVMMTNPSLFQIPDLIGGFSR
jgi:hypothetical protein